MKSYEDYGTDDFLEDEYFIQWPLHPQEQTDTFWKHFLLHHPQKKETIEEARKIIRMLAVIQKEKEMEYKLRAWKESDLENLVKYANNWEVAKYLTGRFPYPYTQKAGDAFIKFATSSEPTHIFAIEIQGEACGAIGIHPQADIYIKNAELGYWLGEPFWGKGIITKAVKEMVEYGFNTYPINRIFARPFGTNLGSQRVLEKADFTLEGRFEKTIWKKDRFEDELIYAIRRT